MLKVLDCEIVDRAKESETKKESEKKCPEFMECLFVGYFDEREAKRECKKGEGGIKR